MLCIACKRGFHWRRTRTQHGINAHSHAHSKWHCPKISTGAQPQHREAWGRAGGLKCGGAPPDWLSSSAHGAAHAHASACQPRRPHGPHGDGLRGLPGAVRAHNMLLLPPQETLRSMRQLGCPWEMGIRRGHCVCARKNARGGTAAGCARPWFSDEAPKHQESQQHCAHVPVQPMPSDLPSQDKGAGLDCCTTCDGVLATPGALCDVS